jgi:hypothetical protein
MPIPLSMSCPASARLLEDFGAGQRADAISHLLVDVSRDLSHGSGRAVRENIGELLSKSFHA